MRLKLSFLALAVLVCVLAVIPRLPSSEAQDTTPIPTPGTGEGSTPLLRPTADRNQVQNTAMVIGLPFSDAFDENVGWVPHGSWRFDTETAYSGAGWILDGGPREQISILEYTNLIDLTGTLSAQLIYRQKGSLPDTDLIALDISLDSGQSWITVDQQIGVESEWEQHIVDLTKYRGQVIRMQFRVNTGARISEDEIVTGSYQIDNLSIQFVITPPPMVLLPIDQTPRTMVGLHLIVGARKEQVVELAERLHDAGRPLGTLKGTSGTEEILNAVAEVSPETIIVYRSLLTARGMTDCPNFNNSPEFEAQLWIGGLVQYWAKVDADYYEITNECLPPMEWLVPFTIEAIRLANEQGRCLLVFSFPGGHPEPSDYAKLLPVYEYILQNPCASGRYHGIALHTYSGNPQQLVSESDIWLGYRHRLFYAQILPRLPEAIRIPVYFTETGPGDGRTQFRCEDVVRDMIQYTQQLEFDPYIRGLHLWNLGPGLGSGDWVDVTPCLPMLGDALINYYAGR